MEKDLFLLIRQDVDFSTIYGIYNDYIQAESDYYNLKKYTVIYGELHIFKLDVNKFYQDENYEKVL